MEPNFSSLLEYWEDTASSPEPGDDAPPYFWWPPGFLEDAIPEDAPPTREDTDISQRLARAFRTIERQRIQIDELNSSLELWKNIELRTLQKLTRFKRRCRAAVQGTVILLLLIALWLWHEAIATVGWNILHSVASALGTTAEFLSGLLIAARLTCGMWALAKSVFRAAMEDLFPNRDTYDLCDDAEEVDIP